MEDRAAGARERRTRGWRRRRWGTGRGGADDAGTVDWRFDMRVQGARRDVSASGGEAPHSVPSSRSPRPVTQARISFQKGQLRGERPARQVFLSHTRRVGSLPPKCPCGKASRRPASAAAPPHGILSLVATTLTDGRQVGPMFDSLTIARQLTDAGIDRGHADALADAIRQAAEHGEHVTPERFDAGIAELRTEITALESRIYRAMLVQAGAIVGALVGIVGIVVGALRLLG